MNNGGTWVFPDAMLSEASDKMLHHNIGRLPVVEWSDRRKLVGYLARHGVMAARLGRLMKNTFANRAGSEEDFREGEGR
jgi:hypothetical protein